MVGVGFCAWVAATASGARIERGGSYRETLAEGNLGGVYIALYRREHGVENFEEIIAAVRGDTVMDAEKVAGSGGEEGAEADFRHSIHTAWQAARRLLSNLTRSETVKRTTKEVRPELSVKNGIGGESAGLLHALLYVDYLTTGDLSGGRRVAATGVISIEGKLGAVAGVARKIEAAEGADADVMFVPWRTEVPEDFEGGVDVVGVKNLSEAVQWLCGHDGKAEICPRTQGLRGVR